jgi:predicted RND superfamily exporter protein
MFLFRSVKLSVIAFLPNAFPIIVVYGMMGLTGLPLNSGTAMVATVALGIALNDTIHFILHYQKLTREQGHSQDSALRETFQHIGRPVVLMTVVHVAGFMIFLVTDFMPLYHFGLLASLAMIAALIGDTVMLPNLLRVFDRPPFVRNNVENLTPRREGANMV